MADREYLDLLLKIRDHGTPVVTRNAPVRRVFAHAVRFERTPLVGVRKTAWRNALREWEWFMSGSESVNDLHPAVRHWWEPWATKGHPVLEDGLVGFNYSYQFRRADATSGYAFDQVAYLIDGIRRHPYSRRNCITTWNTKDMVSEFCPITNCHGTHIQAVGNPDGSLDLFTSQRSADVVCGVPHNWAQYWAFLMWLACRAGRTVGSLVWLGVDCHTYDAHVPVVAEILAADPDPDPPRLVYTPTADAFLAGDFSLDRPYKPKVLTRAVMVV